jgi:hypothetical protein
MRMTSIRGYIDSILHRIYPTIYTVSESKISNICTQKKYQLYNKTYKNGNGKQ